MLHLKSSMLDFNEFFHNFYLPTVFNFNFMIFYVITIAWVKINLALFTANIMFLRSNDKVDGFEEVSGDISG